MKKLTQSEFDKIVLKNVCLRDAKLENVSFDGATMDNISFRDATLDEITRSTLPTQGKENEETNAD